VHLRRLAYVIVYFDLRIGKVWKVAVVLKVNHKYFEHTAEIWLLVLGLAGADCD